MRNFLKSQNVVDIGFVSKEKQELLNSTELSVNEFKEKWLELNKKESQTQKMQSSDLAKIVQPTEKQENKGSFKIIQAVSKNTQTYDINKDTKFAYQRELLRFEQEKGINVLWLMQKLEEKGEKVVDKMI